MTPTPDPTTPTPAPASAERMVPESLSRLEKAVETHDWAELKPEEAADLLTYIRALAQPQPAAAALADGGLRAGVEGLRDEARSAGQARLSQADAHLTTHPRAAMYDGTAAQVHQLYADRLAALLEKGGQR